MMRTLALSTVVMALALLAGAHVVAAQSGDEAAVAQAVEAFRNAMLKADRSQFEALTADQLSYGHSAGRVENKAQFIDAATSGRSTWKFITLTDQTTQIVGNTAIVRHTLTGETERDGKTNPVKIGVLMVWHKPDGHWQLLARQAVRLEEPRTN
ncbi:MAG: nuclear transport factor 2 family protein [Candidatus Entotheonellia bacterium]